MSQTISGRAGAEGSQFTRDKLPVPMGRTVIDRDGFPKDVIMTRTADSINIDMDGYKNDVRFVTTSGRCYVDREGQVNDVDIRLTPGQIVIDREAVAKDMVVRFGRNEITIDREDYANDCKISFANSQIQVEFEGYNRDVRIQRNGDKIFVDREGTKDDYTIPIALFPGGWPSKPSLLSVCDFIGMEPTIADALDRWNANGQVNLDDLVRATPRGEVLILDNRFV